MNNICKTGQTASSSGKFECTNCGQILNLSEGETFPPCPRCSNTEFTKK